MIKLNYVDAIAGAGKSYTSLKEVHASVLKGGWVLFVVPTVALINEAAAQFRRLSPQRPAECIHNETADIVGAALMKALKERPEGGRILFITWSAFLSLPFFPGRELWSAYFDEIPQVTTVDELLVPTSHVHLTAHVEVRPQGPVWGRVVVKKKGPLRKLSETKDTSLKTSLAPVAKTLLSPKWTSYARIETFNALVNGKGEKLTLHSVLRPRIFSGFRKVTMLGANFTNSLLYKMWTLEGVIFEEDHELKGGLRTSEHSNGGLVTIYYGLDAPWSKSVRDRQDKIIWRKLVAAAEDRMSGQPFGWIANKDINTDPFPGLPAESLPQVSHGLNSFQHLDNVVFLSARLPSPDHFAFLEWMGIGGEEVRRATYFEPVYQTVLRCSIRDPNNVNPKVVVIPDRSAAEFLQSLLPGSKVANLNIDLEGVSVIRARGRPKKHQDGTGRVQHHRAKRQVEINQLSAIMNSDPSGGTNEEFKRY
jgi:hypothetical protein